MERWNWCFQLLVERDWWFFLGGGGTSKIVLRLLVSRLDAVLCTRIGRRLKF